ncbi:hypothetical protein UA75_23310 [Actinoalloteichus sp. GBA129-24]|uniref:Uncharacterized protein n=2 Tax=Pseudonocardiaceae TaxID=2070 RepID=A0AAC9LEQ4_9PSEU|nr:hypothetical protein UA74_22800 [Actinoalloteichus fjordicus]APU22644.1 hypothetical protein UA75_23310 [Actinoalloteichus sp. GBA129-24]
MPGYANDLSSVDLGLVAAEFRDAVSVMTLGGRLLLRLRRQTGRRLRRCTVRFGRHERRNVGDAVPDDSMTIGVNHVLGLPDEQLRSAHILSCGLNSMVGLLDLLLRGTGGRGGEVRSPVRDRGGGDAGFHARLTQPSVRTAKRSEHLSDGQ